MRATRLFFSCLLISFFPACLSAQAYLDRIRIIPQPVSVESKKGNFRITSATRIRMRVNNPEAARIAEDFVRKVKLSSGISMQIDTDQNNDSDRSNDTDQNNDFDRSNDSANIFFVDIGAVDGTRSDEGYALNISEPRVTITASGLPGLFYAFITLEQLMPLKFHKKTKTDTINIPCSKIVDYPRFSYRGMHLDVSRHFFPASFIKRFIDILATYKINTFHWHLTDSHGWRLQIDKYPLLTAVGAWRAPRPGIPMTIAEPTGPNETASYGGYYTRAQVKEIVQYAKERFITIIPEIEMPGHTTAALVAYPKYSDLGNPVPLRMPGGYPGDLKHNFCVGYDSTYLFLKNVLAEVAELFPSEYIHIGGDEVRGEPWLGCARCQSVMKQHDLHTVKDLQIFFTRRMDSILHTLGRKMIGWEEILWANVSKESIPMVWHTDEGAIENAKKGYNVVMTPYRYTYFDFYQSQPDLEEDITYAPLFLDTVYAFEPVPSQLDEASARRVLGGQACLWTENVGTEERVEYMLLPRLFALSESLWTPRAKKDYAWFVHRTENEFHRLGAQGINYATSLYNIAIHPQRRGESVEVALRDQVAGKYAIRYTLDGSQPNGSSPLYKDPFHINKSATLHTALFDGNRLLGRPNLNRFSIHKGFGRTPLVTGSPMASTDSSFLRLADGIFGTAEPFDGRWVQLSGAAPGITIDLHAKTAIHSVALTFLEDEVAGLSLPQEIKVLVSSDGKTFTPVYSVVNKNLPLNPLRNVVKYGPENMLINGRYVRILLKVPEGTDMRGEAVRLMIDEIVIE